jgi:phosphoribosylglycinamide formyltransferase 1
VNEKYDDGAQVFQARFEVTADDNMESIAQKIASLEMRYFPEAIRRILTA